MTGEITLRGEVLPIGGLKEKLLAAGRGGIKTVLIPEENVKDLAEIPDEIKNRLDIHPVRWIEQVLERRSSGSRRRLPTKPTRRAPPVPPAPARTTTRAPSSSTERRRFTRVHETRAGAQVPRRFMHVDRASAQSSNARRASLDTCENASVIKSRHSRASIADAIPDFAMPRLHCRRIRMQVP